MSYYLSGSALSRMKCLVIKYDSFLRSVGTICPALLTETNYNPSILNTFPAFYYLSSFLSPGTYHALQFSIVDNSKFK